MDSEVGRERPVNLGRPFKAGVGYGRNQGVAAATLEFNRR